MATTKLTYHKEWSFASNYVSVLDSLKKSYFDVVFGSFFLGVSLSVLQKEIPENMLKTNSLKEEKKNS